MFTSRRVCRDRACVQQQSASLASTALDFHPSTGCSSVYGVASLLDERHLPHDYGGTPNPAGGLGNIL